MIRKAEAPEPARERITVTGIRVSQGNAVDCPQIRDDAGAIHSVSYLSPRVAVGAWVQVRGYLAVTTTCLGTVLIVEDETIPAN